MKKAAIVTLYNGSYNFGGLLQAYALQKKVSSYNVECEVVDYAAKGKLKKVRVLRVTEVLRRFKSIFLLNIFSSINKSLKIKLTTKKKLFNEFRDGIPHTQLITKQTKNMIANKYDYWIVGSDVVWNMETLSVDDFTLLKDVTSGKKISYAASSGAGNRNAYTASTSYKYYSNLINFTAISVREEGFKNLLISMFNYRVQTVLDPVLLFDSSEWDEIAVELNNKGKYAFVYMIHSCNETKKNIYEYCKRNKLLMVTVAHSQGWYKSADKKFADIQAIDLGPKEWIGYIKNAEIIFTDSFHGTAFSVLYHKRFWSFETIGKVDSVNLMLRKYCLLKKLSIPERCVPYSFDLSDDIIVNKKIDYSEVNKLLLREREFSENFLKNALQIEGK